MRSAVLWEGQVKGLRPSGRGWEREAGGVLLVALAGRLLAGKGAKTFC